MDKFFKVKNCERCGAPLNGVRIMSMFNTQVICMNCKDKEKSDPEYNEAVQADHNEIKSGNFNFKGIRG
jgi:uncharacterized Zn finger protein (UPF0148 family)